MLDLHNFLPSEVGDLTDDYIEQCYQQKIWHVRIIHGKGKGNLRRTVHSRLEKNKYVESFSLDGGNWGATIAKLADV